MQTKHLLSLMVGLTLCASVHAQKDTICISTGDELYENLRTYPTADGYPVFKLTADIVVELRGGENFDNIEMVSEGATQFNGTLLGDGHTITHNGRLSSASGLDYPYWGGFFSAIGEKGAIRNTSFVFCGRYDATTLASPGDSPAQYAGLITAINYGTIEGCEVVSSKYGSGFMYCQYDTTTTSVCYMGGFCGVNYGTISNCSNNSKVWYSRAKTDDTTPAMNENIYPAGICGLNEGSVRSCFDANYAGLRHYEIGGIRAYYPVVGKNVESTDGTGGGTIDNCLAYVLKPYSETLLYNALKATSDNITVLDRNSATTDDITSAVSSFAKLSGDAFANTFGSYNNGLPFLKSIRRYYLPTDGNGTFYIKTADQFNLVNSYSNMTHPDSFVDADRGSTFILLNDIGSSDDIAAIDTVRQSIDGMGGTFNGMGHEIALESSEVCKGALFQMVHAEGVVKNLGLSFLSPFTFDSAISGSITNENEGKIINCYVTNYNINYLDMSTISSSTGTIEIGGIAARNNGTIQSCYTNVNINPYFINIPNEMPTASIYAGGIVANNTGQIVDCFNTYDSFAEETGASYLFGYSNATELLTGNIVGYNSGTVNMCYGLKTATTIETEDGGTTETYVEHLCGSDAGTATVTGLDPVENELNTIKEQATFAKYFVVPLAWKSGVTENGYGYPLLRYVEIDLPKEDATDIVVHISDTASVTAISQLFADAPEQMQTATIVLDRNIDYGTSLTDVIADPSSNSTSHSLIGSKEYPFSGTFEGNGNTIKNYNFKADSSDGGADFGFFGYVGEDAVIDGVRLDSCSIYLDCATINALIANIPASDGDANPEDKDMADIGLFVGTNKGTISNCVVVGTVFYDDECIEDPSVIENLNLALFAGCNEGSIDHCIIFTPQLLNEPDDTDVTGEDNKACIAIKSTIGIGRDKKKTTKTATITSNKAAADEEEDLLFGEEANKDIREFTYEQFADGTVAYWLNYKDKGYTGEYGGMWSQGEKLPELINPLDPKPLYRIAIRNVNGSESQKATLTKRYANVGDLLTLTYAEDNLPSKIIVDGHEQTTQLTTVTVPKKTTFNDGIVLIEVVFAQSTDIDRAEAAPAVRVSGCRNAIRISTPASAAVSIHNASGLLIDRRTVAEGTTELNVPAGGVYVATVDGQAFKVVVR